MGESGGVGGEVGEGEELVGLWAHGWLCLGEGGGREERLRSRMY